MRRLRYQVAASLDGFIAGPNGEFDWIVMDPSIDFATLYKEHISGRPAKVTRVPLGVARTVSRLVRPAHPGLSQILQASVLAAERAERFDARPLMARFPITLTRLEDWVTRHASA